MVWVERLIESIIRNNKTNMKDQTYEYMLLGRLQQDCYYFLEHPVEKHLWALDVEAQITKMKELWETLEEKPHWITWTEILDFEQSMKELKEGKL